MPNAAVLAALEARFRRMGRVMAEVNKRQALVIEGADVLENARGTAPGLWLETNGRIVVLLPGPPHELEALFVEKVEPRLQRLAGAVRLHARELRTVGLTESDLEQRIAPIYSTYRNAQTTVLAAPGSSSRSTFASGRRTPPPTEAMLDAMIPRASRRRLANTSSLRQANRSKRSSRASSTITPQRWPPPKAAPAAWSPDASTRIAGSSAYFLGGVVSYSNALKIAWLVMPAALIESHGAVSSRSRPRPRRRHSPQKLARRLGLGITGIAGPSGGSPEKPVGTVHIVWHAPECTTPSVACDFPGDRERVRRHASQIALDLVRRYFFRPSRRSTPSQAPPLPGQTARQMSDCAPSDKPASAPSLPDIPEAVARARRHRSRRPAPAASTPSWPNGSISPAPTSR